MATTVGGVIMAPKKPTPATATAPPKPKPKFGGVGIPGKPAPAAPAPAPVPEPEPEPATPAIDGTVEDPGAEWHLAAQSLLWHAKLIGQTLGWDDGQMADVCEAVAEQLRHTAPAE